MTRLCLWCACAVFLQWTVTGQQLVSQGKPITSSSQHETWSADKAVDGNKTPIPDICDCCAATAKEVEPWYKLDLEQTYMVLRINVIGRSRYQNLREMEIKLGISSEDGTVLTKNTANVFSYDYILPSPQLGRYVTLTLRGISEFFVICEFEVYAACEGGKYGPDCISNCGNCLNNATCDKQDGRCNACAAGYTGDKCLEQCKDGTYGEGCTSICGNCHCDEICNKQNGTCQACECGYTGQDCKGEINPAASRGDWPYIAMIVGGTLVSILAIEGVAVAIFFLIRKRRCSLKRDTINRSNPYELPNRGNNEGEHDYESAMELDVDTNAYENTGHQAT